MALRRRSTQDSKFNELLVRFPPPPPAAPIAPLQQQQQRLLPNQYGRAKRVPIEDGQTSGAAVPVVDASLAPATAVAGTQEEDEYGAITRMRLTKIRTTCNHQHHHH